MNLAGARRAARAGLSLAIPFAAVWVGLYEMGSAWAALLLYESGMALVLLTDRPRFGLRSLFRGWRARGGAPLVFLCAASGPILALLWSGIALDPGDLDATLANLGLSGAGWALFALLYVTVHPCLEEAFWRDPALGAGGRVRAGGPIRDTAFAGYHLLVLLRFLRPAWALAALLPLWLIAGWWRRAAERNGGLAIPVVSHSVAGLSTIAAVQWLLRR